MAISRFRSILYVIPRRFLSTAPPPPSSSSSSSFAVDYLVKSCGLPMESALMASRKLKLKAKNNGKLDSVLQFLKSHGFTDAHISALVQKRPTVLHCRISNNLGPKFEFFNKVGFVGKQLPDLVVSNPLLVKNSLDSFIRPAVEYLLLLLGSSERIMAAVKRSSWLLSYDLKGNMLPNVELLLGEGVPREYVVSMVTTQPRFILTKHCRMVQAVSSSKKMGIDPKSRMFLHSLRANLSMSDSTVRHKMELMKSIGWTEEEILSASKRYPLFLGCSEEKIRRAVDFYVNTMKLEASAVIKHPKLIMHSIEKRMRPMFAVLQVLASKKLVSGDPTKLVLQLMITEFRFVQNFVAKYEAAVPGLFKKYEAAKAATTTRKRKDR